MSILVLLLTTVSFALRAGYEAYTARARLATEGLAQAISTAIASAVEQQGAIRIEAGEAAGRAELLGADPGTLLASAVQLAPKLTFHSANPSGPPQQAGARAPSLCAQHVRSLGSESLLSNLMEVKD